MWPQLWKDRAQYINPLYKAELSQTQGVLRPNTTPYCFKWVTAADTAANTAAFIIHCCSQVNDKCCCISHSLYTRFTDLFSDIMIQWYNILYHFHWKDQCSSLFSLLYTAECGRVSITTCKNQQLLDSHPLTSCLLWGSNLSRWRRSWLITRKYQQEEPSTAITTRLPDKANKTWTQTHTSFQDITISPSQHLSVQNSKMTYVLSLIFISLAPSSKQNSKINKLAAALNLIILR